MEPKVLLAYESRFAYMEFAHILGQLSCGVT